MHLDPASFDESAFPQAGLPRRVSLDCAHQGSNLDPLIKSPINHLLYQMVSSKPVVQGAVDSVCEF
jgi:hypothetical protein